MRRPFFAYLWLVCISALIVPALLGAAKTLEIYFIDVEGGQSTLIVDPEGESLLIDAGWDDFNGRDADRILAAAKAAGIDHIDDLLITHYHCDHVGGVPELSNRITIGRIFDHGPNIQDSGDTARCYAAYQQVVTEKSLKRITVKPENPKKPGPTPIVFKGMKVEVVAAAGAMIASPLPGAGQPNPLCASEPQVPPDPSENSQSVGILVTFGRFRFLDLGDLTNRKEMGLVCPRNLVGTVDLYLVTHHGTEHPGTGDGSNPRALVDALHPRVAVMNNGALKGGHPLAWQTVHDSPGLEGFWQLHYSLAGGEDHNVAEAFIANVGGNDQGNYIKVSAQVDGTFTVTNPRNNYSATYQK